MLETISSRALTLTLCTLASYSACANNNIPSIFNIQIGTISTTYAENQESLKATDSSSSKDNESVSGSASSMPLSISYESFTNLERSYFGRIAGPVMGSTPDRYYSFSAGMNFYFGNFAANANVQDIGFKMSISPKFRYYAGANLGAGYLIFNTKTAKKADVLFEIGGQAGMHYAMTKKYSVSAEVGYSRAVGALTSASVMKILFGTSFPTNIFSN